MTDASLIVALFQNLYVQVIACVILIDVLLGIITAIVKKDFVLGKLANFVKGPVIGYIFGFAVLEMVTPGLPMLGSLDSGSLVLKFVFVLIVLALLASIFRNLAKLGLSLPKVLKG